MFENIYFVNGVEFGRNYDCECTKVIIVYTVVTRWRGVRVCDVVWILEICNVF